MYYIVNVEMQTKIKIRDNIINKAEPNTPYSRVPSAESESSVITWIHDGTTLTLRVPTAEAWRY